MKSLLIMTSNDNIANISWALEDAHLTVARASDFLADPWFLDTLDDSKQLTNYMVLCQSVSDILRIHSEYWGRCLENSTAKQNSSQQQGERLQ